MQVTSSSDLVLALFPGQGTPGQNWGCAGGGEKQWDLGQDCTRDPTSTRGWAGPGDMGSQRASHCLLAPLACGAGLLSRS